jgi:1-acyl-sn-glycerol-3-phosphate acyltransferase
MRYAVFLIFNIIWITKDRPEVDYSEYLGKDWKCEYKGASTLVCNHSNWLDAFIIYFFYEPSVLAKREVLKMPIFNIIIKSAAPMYIDRAATHEDRDRLV